MEQELFGWTYEANTSNRSCLQGEGRGSSQFKDRFGALTPNILNSNHTTQDTSPHRLVHGQCPTHTQTMKKKTKKNLATKTFDMNTVRNALDDMRRKCGGGNIPSKMVSATARAIGLTPDELAEAAGRLNRPFANDHVR